MFASEIGLPVTLRKRARALFRLIHSFSAVILLSTLILQMQPAQAADTNHRTAQTILHMLDYVSVDYGGAVLLEKVLNENEYKEQTEFSKQAVRLIGELPEHPHREALIAQALELERLIDAKAPTELVNTSAQQLRRDIIATYQIQVTPRQIPDLKRAAVLFQQKCAKCHGAEGHGNGPDGKTLNPKPADFHDMARMGQRSAYGLYNTITLGVAGTEMKGFTQLTDDERWSLAFLVSNFRNSKEYIEEGRKLWEKGAYNGPAPDLAALTTLTSNETVLRYGEQTRAVLAYLRAYPQALETKRRSTLLFAAEQLDRAMTHYREGDHARALRLAIAAYLEGFEPVEVSLDSLDKQLRRNIELEMMGIRQLVNSGSPNEKVERKIEYTKNLLLQADELLRTGKLSITSAFASAFFVLLREGIEGMLVLTAIITFVARSGQRNALLYIHAGWGGALLLGAFTWVAAAWLVDISGAGREVTEGMTALIASAMLVYVGFWLHNKTHAQHWQKFLNDQLGEALEKKTLWVLALVSFLAVYREIFETVLFSQALWAQVSDVTRPALWGGMMSAALMLLIIGWILFRFGITLPLGPFFSGTSILLAILAVVFAGQGVAALQSADIVTTSPVGFVSLPMLGVYPTAQTLLVQAMVIGILLLCYRIPLRRKSA
ncbi:MAG: cytochrome c/FTR1 family iron permease [Nitrosomonadales bacterium]|nr:cytochrome c/FTR1 family iron permease [Nitrosomonadales bacterium]